jgi:hypothetical protein
VLTDTNYILNIDVDNISMNHAFLLLVLSILVISGSGCSIVPPESVHVSRVWSTTDPGIFIFQIGKGMNYDLTTYGKVIFDSRKKELVTTQDYSEVVTLDPVVTTKISPSVDIQDDKLKITGYNKLLITVSLSGENLTTKDEILVIFESIALERFFVIYQTSSMQELMTNNSRFLIVDSANGNLIDAKNIGYLPYRASSLGILYESEGILKLSLGGADCVSSIYLHYSLDNLEILFETFIADYWTVLEDQDRLIQISNPWNKNETQINFFNYQGDLTEKLIYTENDFLEKLSESDSSIVETNAPELPVLLFPVMISLLASVKIRKIDRY